MSSCNVWLGSTGQKCFKKWKKFKSISYYFANFAIYDTHISPEPTLTILLVSMSSWNILLSISIAWNNTRRDVSSLSESTRSFPFRIWKLDLRRVHCLVWPSLRRQCLWWFIQQCNGRLRMYTVWYQSWAEYSRPRSLYLQIEKSEFQCWWPNMSVSTWIWNTADQYW